MKKSLLNIALIALLSSLSSCSFLLTQKTFEVGRTHEGIAVSKQAVPVYKIGGQYYITGELRHYNKKYKTMDSVLKPQLTFKQADDSSLHEIYIPVSLTSTQVHQITNNAQPPTIKQPALGSPISIEKASAFAPKKIGSAIITLPRYQDTENYIAPTGKTYRSPEGYAAQILQPVALTLDGTFIGAQTVSVFPLMMQFAADEETPVIPSTNNLISTPLPKLNTPKVNEVLKEGKAILDTPTPQTSTPTITPNIPKPIGEPPLDTVPDDSADSTPITPPTPTSPADESPSDASDETP